VSRERQCEHRVGGGNMPDEVVVVRAHLSGGSTVSGGGRGWRRRGAHRRRWAPVSGGVGSGSYSTGEEGQR
jgi:hypothetical protein